MFYEAMILMSQDLKNASYQIDIEHWTEYTPPIKFSFTDRPLVFYRQENKYQVIVDRILPNSNGIIVNLGGRVLDLNYLADKDASEVFHPSHLKRLVEAAYQTKLPLVFAVEDTKDSFEHVTFFVNEGRDEDKIGTWTFIDKPPIVISLDDDIWEPTSPTIQTIRNILNIPAGMSVMPYSYRYPISIQNILTRLVADIEYNE